MVVQVHNLRRAALSRRAARDERDLADQSRVRAERSNPPLGRDRDRTSDEERGGRPGLPGRLIGVIAVLPVGPMQRPQL